jgi:hypothetical protein
MGRLSPLSQGRNASFCIGSELAELKCLIEFQCDSFLSDHLAAADT